MNRFFVALIAVVLLPFQAGSQETTSGGLNPGDQIRIVVWRNPELSGDFFVAADGTVTHPLYREVQVTGLAMPAVEERLRTFLTRYTTNPQFVVMALVRVVLGGEVRNPNIYSVPPETTIAQAIAVAGGPTDEANLRSVRIFREGQQVTVNLARADEETARLRIRSGDQILIPRQRNSFGDGVGPVMSTAGVAIGIANIFIR